MIELNGFNRADVPSNNRPHHPHDLDRVFGKIDFPAKQRHAAAKAFSLSNQLERIPCRAGAAAKNTDDQVRGIIGSKFCHRAGTVVLHLKEQGHFLPGNAGETPHDGIIDEGAEVRVSCFDRESRIENLEEVGHAHFFQVHPKVPVGL